MLSPTGGHSSRTIQTIDDVSAHLAIRRLNQQPIQSGTALVPGVGHKHSPLAGLKYESKPM